MKYFDQKSNFFHFLDFIPFVSPKRVYPEYNMSFDQKLDFSWHMTILGHFQNPANLGNFSIFWGNIFLYVKNRHTNLFSSKKLKKWVCYLIKTKKIVCGQDLWRWLYLWTANENMLGSLYSTWGSRICKVVFGTLLV